MGYCTVPYFQTNPLRNILKAMVLSFKCRLFLEGFKKLREHLQSKSRLQEALTWGVQFQLEVEI